MLSPYPTAVNGRLLPAKVFERPEHARARQPAFVDFFVTLGSNGYAQLCIILLSLVWVVARTIQIRRNGTGKASPFKPRNILVFEVLSHALRALSLAFFIVASGRDQKHCTSAIAVGYAFLLGLFRVVVRGDTRPMLLRQMTTIILSTLSLTAAAELLPLVVIGSKYRPDKMSAFAMASLACAVLLAGFSPREWQPPPMGLELPEHLIPEPSPEETCSWINANITFSSTDKLVYKSLKNNLTMSDMPKIPWRYNPEHLRRQFANIRKENKTTGQTLLALLWPQLLQCAFFATIFPFCELLGPFSMNRLLEYMQNPDEAMVQPYVWLAIGFGGRILETIFTQKYIALSRKIAMYCKLMLTAEVFHSSLGSRELEGNFLQDPESEDRDESDEGAATGMLENLISTDIEAIVELRSFVMPFAQIPCGMLATLGLYAVIGWPCFVGFAITLVSAPVAGFLMGFMNDFEEKLKTFQDRRISMLSEYLRSIKAIRYFGWEDSIVTKVRQVRANEQRQNWNMAVLILVFEQITSVLPILSLLSIFGLHVLVRKLPMTAAIAYTTVTLLENVRQLLMWLAATAMMLPRFLVAMRRFNRFFDATSPLDDYIDGPAQICNATFRRTKAAEFRLHDIDLAFVAHGLNTITGVSGSGKTTLLLALLGETVREAGRVSRPKDAAFASQTSWLQSQSVRDNIVFADSYDEARYSRVIKACCLDVDFEELPNGDRTQVGENGSALSGGQRARVALARALFSAASLLLLDDIFSALDTKTSSLLWNRIFCSDLVKNRTVILVTQLGWVVQEADLNIVLENGRVQSTNRKLGHTRKPHDVASVSLQENESQPITDDSVAAPVTATEDAAGNQVDDEVEKTGVLDGIPALQYLLYFGGPLVLILMAGLLIMQCGVQLGAHLWLSVWVDSPAEHTVYYLAVYSGISFAAEALDIVSLWSFLRGCWTAANKLHDRAVVALFNVSLSWYTENPVGRVMNRLSGDIQGIDQEIVWTIYSSAKVVLMALVTLGAITDILPVFIGPTLLLAAIALVIGALYNRNGVRLKQLTSAAQSPILSRFSEGIQGMSVIRATASVPAIFNARLGEALYSSAEATTAVIEADQWIKFRMNGLAAAINLCAAFLAIWERRRLSAGIVGFCLSQATLITTAILYLVYDVADLNILMQTFHRVQQYGSLTPEEKPIDEKSAGHATYSDDVRLVPQSWPSSGTVEFRNVTIRYDADGPDILRNINLIFNAGERIGVVGRTGSGKSTLVLSMLRFTEIVSGQILYDGVDIATIPRKQLRQAISMIPQESQLFQGTLAENLDPTGKISEHDLQKALSVCQSIAALKPTGSPSASESEDGDGDGDANANFSDSLSLLTKVKAKGENFSHGQRQILSLCRILARQSKLMLLDEATSNMDPETDAGIQKALREAASEGEGRCVITIAHRLKTIADYDKVVVMGAGEVLEVGSPAELMEKQRSYYDLVMHDRDQTPAAPK